MWNLVRSIGLSVLLASACGSPNKATDDGPSPSPTDYFQDILPANFPRPFVPDDEPLTAARVELGRHLFYDKRLSHNETQACASCHVQALAFTDGRAKAVGSTGEAHFRNSMSLTNIGYASALTWANPTQGSLAEQALIPMFGENPTELGLSGHENELITRLDHDERYRSLFGQAFAESDPQITLRNIVVALASFERTIISYRSPYDKFTYGNDETALDAKAQRGMALFFGERFECFHCHQGFNFSDSTRTATSPVGDVPFHNTGLYNLDAYGSFPEDDTGLMLVTDNFRDMGRFRAPTLRNIELTAPYFHDGSAKTLDDVLDHYARGGRLIHDGPHAGNGAHSPLKSGFVRGFTMTEEEREEITAFLKSLTDSDFISDPTLSDPW